MSEDSRIQELGRYSVYVDVSPGPDYHVDIRVRTVMGCVEEALQAARSSYDYLLGTSKGYGHVVTRSSSSSWATKDEGRLAEGTEAQRTTESLAGTTEPVADTCLVQDTYADMFLKLTDIMSRAPKSHFGK